LLIVRREEGGLLDQAEAFGIEGQRKEYLSIHHCRRSTPALRRTSAVQQRPKELAEAMPEASRRILSTTAPARDFHGVIQFPTTVVLA
jgi:hypothetical protein